MKTFYFKISRDFYALQEVFVRAIRNANKMSTLKAIYLLPENTKKLCEDYYCEHEKIQAVFNLVFEYSHKEKKPKFEVNLCFDCLYNQLKEYFDDILEQIKAVKKEMKIN